MTNYNLDSCSPLANILKAFEAFYQSSDLQSLPKEEKSEDYWSDMWFDFKKVEPFETFLPYLFYTGLITQEHWEAFVKYGSLSFKVIDDMVNKGVYISPMDWIDTALCQPHWYNHEQYLKTGAELNEFIESILFEFEGKYIEFDKVHSKEFWQEYSNLKETDVMWLLSHMKDHPKPPYKVQGHYTPNNIKSLKAHEIFVFGSNTEGRHGAGAAAQAKRWGAVQGQGKGQMGKTYGIITKDLKGGKRSVPLSKIQEQIKEMLDYALKHPELDFLVTAIGCGLGGYSVNEIANLFPKELPANVLLPKIFGIPNPNWKEKKEATSERLKFKKTDNTLKGVLGKSDKPWM